MILEDILNLNNMIIEDGEKFDAIVISPYNFDIIKNNFKNSKTKLFNSIKIYSNSLIPDHKIMYFKNNKLINIKLI